MSANPWLRSAPHSAASLIEGPSESLHADLYAPVSRVGDVCGTEVLSVHGHSPELGVAKDVAEIICQLQRALAVDSFELRDLTIARKK